MYIILSIFEMEDTKNGMAAIISSHEVTLGQVRPGDSLVWRSDIL